uniref:Peptidase M1 leukotriene A4 hydrolase/aminopeptidase C-terminal domain-containing protein n=1 Tax=Rhodosorus marinus TaxID=101924 RepID=A0A7S2ZPL4_9RHOD|mmetsp:Transcript_26688/g.103733  ORF Transcript_26688/g.103733 Transcript_26688/m.103733 type:complete len:594 (+) Transcript_26688:816-2597(+)
MGKDLSTYSDISDVVTRSIDLSLDVDFETLEVRGWTTLQLEVLAKEEIREVVLDAKGLEIQAVVDDTLDTKLDFVLGEDNKVMGRKLTILLSQGARAQDSLTISIQHTVKAEKSPAVQFLQPHQTVGGQHPYFFTQCHAINARSIVPCQDTPAAKVTYTACINVKTPLKAVMSALAIPESAASRGIGKRRASTLASGFQRFFFEQKIPICTYLLALAVGDLVSADIGPRSSVWCEPGVLKAAEEEFVGTEKFLAAAESLVGEYRWGRYDLLILPPSFPHGGMENPCLTFVTPTLVVGDRSMVHVIAHEIAHSWFGNSLSIGNWEDVWLSEGFAVFLERKIIERVHGLDMKEMHSTAGRSELLLSVERRGKDHPITRLVPDLTADEDPDVWFSTFAYEKGCLFLDYLEEKVGGPAVFEPFLKDYTQEYAMKTVSSALFQQYFEKRFGNIDGLDFDDCLKSPGLPFELANNPTPRLVIPALKVQREITDYAMAGKGELREEDIAGWSVEQIIFLLNALLDSQISASLSLDASTTRELDRIYRFSSLKNGTCVNLWQLICISAGDSAVLDPVVEILRNHGRLRYVYNWKAACIGHL